MSALRSTAVCHWFPATARFGSTRVPDSRWWHSALNGHPTAAPKERKRMRASVLAARAEIHRPSPTTSIPPAMHWSCAVRRGQHGMAHRRERGIAPARSGGRADRVQAQLSARNRAARTHRRSPRPFRHVRPSRRRGGFEQANFEQVYNVTLGNSSWIGAGGEVKPYPTRRPQPALLNTHRQRSTCNLPNRE